MKESNLEKQVLKVAKKLVKDRKLFTNQQVVSYYIFFKKILKLEEDKYNYKISMLNHVLDQLLPIQKEVLVKLYNLDGKGKYSYLDLSQETGITVAKIIVFRKNAIYEIKLYMWKNACKGKFVATLENIGLKKRSYCSLLDSNIETVPQLLKYTEEELKSKCISLGQVSIEDIKDRLSHYGLYLKDHLNENGTDLTLENMGLSARSYHALIKNKITTVPKLLSKSEIELQKECFYLGEKSIKNIKERLHAYKLQLMDPRQKSIDTLKVIELELCQRTTNMLKKEGITIVDQLVLYTEKELYEITGIDKVFVREIKEALASFQLSLRQER